MLLAERGYDAGWIGVGLGSVFAPRNRAPHGQAVELEPHRSPLIAAFFPTTESSQERCWMV